MGISCLLRLFIMSSFKLLLAVFGGFLLVLPSCLGGVTTSRVLGQGVPFKKTISRGVASSRTNGQNTWTAEDEVKAQLRKADQENFVRPTSGSSYKRYPLGPGSYQKPQYDHDIPPHILIKLPGAYQRDQSSQGVLRDHQNQGVSTSGSTFQRDHQNQGASTGSTFQRDHQNQGVSTPGSSYHQNQGVSTSGSTYQRD